MYAIKHRYIQQNQILSHHIIELAISQNILHAPHYIKIMAGYWTSRQILLNI